MTRVAVIIPSYKQPSLLIEAASDILKQKTNFDYSIIISDDDCPYEQTKSMTELLSLCYENVIICSRKQNGGLSANRNTSITCALEIFPELEAITFLDADDRLDDGALQWLYDCFKKERLERGPEIGWIYTDPYQFGGIYSYLRKPNDYSILWHLLANSNSATSLISIDLIKNGCRFDENMKRGSEDWDFWLQAIRLGYRGAFTTPPTFRYRRRPESMTSDARFNANIIKSYVREKNEDLYNEKYILETAKTEASRYLIYSGEHDEKLSIGYYLNHQKSGSFQSIISAISPKNINPISFYPNMIIVEASEAIKSLNFTLLRDYLFTEAERHLRNGIDCVVIKLTSVPPLILKRELSILNLNNYLELQQEIALIVFYTKSIIKVANKKEEIKILELCCYKAGQPAIIDKSCQKSFMKLLSNLENNGYAKNHAMSHLETWTPEGITSETLVNYLLNSDFITPYLPDMLHVVIAWGDQCNSSELSQNLTKILSEIKNKITITAVVKKSVITLEAFNQLKKFAARVHLISDEDLGDKSKPVHYLGAQLNLWMVEGGINHLNGIYALSKLCIFYEFPELLPMAFQRKQKGAKIWTIQDNSDRKLQISDEANVVSFLDYSLAYEHAIDIIWTSNINNSMYASAMGIPREKISIINNLETTLIATIDEYLNESNVDK